MTSPTSFSIAIAVNNAEVLHNNLLLSPDLRNGSGHQVLIRRDYPSAALAYNSAIDAAENDIVIFAHQDIYFPQSLIADLERSLAHLKAERIDWGVLGYFGSTRDAIGGLGRVYTTGLGLHGREIERPQAVETLDEIVLIIRRSSGLRFDPCLPIFTCTAPTSASRRASGTCRAMRSRASASITRTSCWPCRKSSTTAIASSRRNGRDTGEDAGLIAPYLDSAAFVSHVMRLHDLPNLRGQQGATALAKVRAHHGIESLGSKLLRSIQRSLPGSRTTDIPLANTLWKER